MLTVLAVLSVAQAATRAQPIRSIKLTNTQAASLRGANLKRAGLQLRGTTLSAAARHVLVSTGDDLLSIPCDLEPGERVAQVEGYGDESSLDIEYITTTGNGIETYVWYTDESESTEDSSYVRFADDILSQAACKTDDP